MDVRPSYSSRDAFGRLRTSTPFTIFDNKFLNDKQPIFWSEKLVGGAESATHDSSNAAINMTVDANGEEIIRQTKQRFNYRAGKSQLFFMTGIMNEPTTNLTQKVGPHDDNGGCYFELEDSTLYVAIKKNGSVTRVAQDNWNIDKLNGAGESAIQLDISKVQIFIIDFAWLGFGAVRFGFMMDGVIVYCHEFHHANNIDSVYLSTPNLPVRYHIISSGATGTLKQVCCSVMSEGGLDKWMSRGASTNNRHVECNTINSLYAILGIRLKSGYLDITAFPTNINVISETNDDFRWILTLNPGVSGTFTYTDVDDSCIQVGRNNAGNPSTETIPTVTGTVLAEGYVSIDSQQVSVPIEQVVGLGADIDGNRDTIVLAVAPLSANADIQGAINWRELL